ncbi:MAG: family 20 glycosylhydrolase [Acidobacteriota bacterium]|jgi:hexosaminidase|nr:family 20 glycosylhydrolase [Acidobacteriota bacterium]
MKARSLFLALCFMAATLPASAPEGGGPGGGAPSLMPWPQSLESKPGVHRLTQNLTLSLEACRDGRVTAAAGRLLERVRLRTGFPPQPPGADPRQASLILRCGGDGEPVQTPNTDESYILDISPGAILLEAPSPVGILRGLESIAQLIALDSTSYLLPCLRIEDRPRFRWRGLHIDVARHWEPVDVILRNLDAMAAVKMNVFHWHLSDDQGFRVESRRFPRLHEIGGEGKYYTQEQVRAVVAYARDRGIRVLPEFEMPGHTTAWLAAYPELAAAPGPYHVESAWGVFDPSMDPSREEVYAHLDAFIGEMASLFPDGYFHVGGDEVNGKQWNSSARIREFKAGNGMKNNRQLQAYFTRRLEAILDRHGKKMVGWDEIVHPSVPPTVTVQTWRLPPRFAETLKLGYPGILSRGYYLDHMHPASWHYGIDPGAGLTTEDAGRILGGEACMWAEFVDEEIIESRIWPRAAAIAERLWSPAGVTDVEDMYRRLDSVDAELERLGVRHRSSFPRLLRNILPGGESLPVAALAEILSPRGLAERQRARRYTRETPLRRLVDILPPESAVGRDFDLLVDRALPVPSPADRAAIRESLEHWRRGALKAVPVLERSFVLAEIVPVAESAAAACALGLEALDRLEAAQAPPTAWAGEAERVLERARKSPEIAIAIEPAITKLVHAADSRHAPRGTIP